jgi:hypothetical protein
MGIRSQCYHVTDAYANTDHHRPGQFRTMKSSRLVDNGPNAFCLDDAPNHKNETSNGCDDRLEREEVATIVSSSVILPQCKAAKRTSCAREAI